MVVVVVVDVEVVVVVNVDVEVVVVIVMLKWLLHAPVSMLEARLRDRIQQRCVG